MNGFPELLPDALRSQLCCDFDLSDYNTLALQAKARYFYRLQHAEQLAPLLNKASEANLRVVVLGGGSNIRLKPWVDALVVQLDLRGIELSAEDEESVWLDVAAGENWHVFVTWCLEHKFYGLENLALIPGTVGAAPVQNIGAYGVEVGDYIESIEVFDRASLSYRTITAEQCEFGYRDSIFKRGFAAASQSQLIICSVRFKLKRHAAIDAEYPALKAELANCAEPIGPEQLYRAVIAVRQSKLPDPAVLANAGSFFKNPVVELAVYDKLLARYPNMPAYVQGDKRYKLAAGWLLEQAGAKALRYKSFSVHQQQALVVVNHADQGTVDFADLAEFCVQLQELVASRFGIGLEPEPVIIA